MNRKFLFFSAVASLVSINADAFVRMTTSAGTPIDWRHSCLQFVVDHTANPDFSTERLRDALGKAADGWTSTAKTCPNSFHVDLLAGDVSDAVVKHDGKNVVVWRLHGFCDLAENKGDEVCLAPNVAASTTVFFRDTPGAPGDGEILETDMEINAVNFVFDDQGAKDRIDLLSVLAHELGHASGLDHVCTTSSGAAPPVDSDGHPVPSCFPLGALAPSITRATMFNFVDPGDTSKRSPGEDERGAVCSIYPAYGGSCLSADAPHGGCGCRLERATLDGWCILSICALAVGACARHKAKRRRR